MTRREIKRQLNILEAQLMDVHSKSERVVCTEYNVDNRQEAIDFLEDEINILEAQIDYCDDDDDDELAGWRDPAFRTEADFYRMRI